MPELALISQASTALIGVLFLAAAYLFAQADRLRADSASKDDDQVGLKTAIFALTIAGLVVAVGGAETLVHYLVSGAKTGTGEIKNGAAGLVAGGLVVGGLVKMLLPRTNTDEFPKVSRLALGFIAALTGMMAIGAFATFVQLMINGGGLPWAAKSGSLSSLVVYGAIAFLSLTKLGSLSGWTTPQRPAAPMAPQGGGPQYHQSGGMQQPGYPPQQAGYPPQGQQMPPQGGAYPPQGGGYPPQGGGGAGGGGYPPQGGGGGYQPR